MGLERLRCSGCLTFVERLAGWKRSGGRLMDGIGLRIEVDFVEVEEVGSGEM